MLPEGWTKNREQFDGKRQWVFTHADGTKQNEHPGKPEGIIALAIAIPDMGALSTLIFGGDKYKKDRAWVTPAPATLKVGMTEANFSDKNFGAGGAIIISAWISHKDNGALIKLDISSNHIGAEQEGGLQRICVASGIELVK